MRQVVVCAAVSTGPGALVNATSGMECFLIDVVPKPAPGFGDRVVRHAPHTLHPTP